MSSQTFGRGSWREAGPGRARGAVGPWSRKTAATVRGVTPGPIQVIGVRLRHRVLCPPVGGQCRQRQPTISSHRQPYGRSSSRRPPTLPEVTTPDRIRGRQEFGLCVRHGGSSWRIRLGSSPYRFLGNDDDAEVVVSDPYRTSSYRASTGSRVVPVADARASVSPTA